MQAPAIAFRVAADISEHTNTRSHGRVVQDSIPVAWLLSVRVVISTSELSKWMSDRRVVHQVPQLFQDDFLGRDDGFSLSQCWNMKREPRC